MSKTRFVLGNRDFPVHIPDICFEHESLRPPESRPERIQGKQCCMFVIMDFGIPPPRERSKKTQTYERKRDPSSRAELSKSDGWGAEQQEVSWLFLVPRNHPISLAEATTKEKN